MSGEEETAVDVLRDVREACLFTDDDGSTGITADPHISEELFNRISMAIKREGA